jgi:hypothetical protein
MCVINVYVDQYPDGKQVQFRQASFCQYGQPGRACQKLSTLENPVRKIQFGEPTTEYMMTTHQRVFTHTPPRSSGGSHHRYSGGDTASDEGHRRRHSKRRSEGFPSRPHRQHKRERIVIVDSPPTPRTPPQLFGEMFTAPSSPATPFIVDNLPRERGRPIIVDERPLPRVNSIGAIVSPRRRARSQSRSRFQWDSPSSSHTSFDSRARREAEELEYLEEQRRRDERDDRIAQLKAERRLEERIRQQDEAIRRRPPVPFPPAPLRQRQLRPVIDQSQVLQGMMGGLTLHDRAGERALLAEAEIRRRAEEQDRALKARLVEQEEQEALKQRLRERQMPNRRFSVGPGNRRHRVLYDDGVYRWE